MLEKNNGRNLKKREKKQDLVITDNNPTSLLRGRVANLNLHMLIFRALKEFVRFGGGLLRVSCWIKRIAQTHTHTKNACYSNLFLSNRTNRQRLGKPMVKNPRSEPPLKPKGELCFRRTSQGSLSRGTARKGISTHVGAIRGKMSATCQKLLAFNHYKIA